MLPINRQQHILTWLKEEGALRISDISARFGVSEMTVYRDVNQLVQSNQVIKRPAASRSQPEHLKRIICAAIA